MDPRIVLIRKCREFLDRTPITGAEAEAMLACKNWLAGTEQALVAVRTGAKSADTPVPQFADTSGK